MLSDPGSDRNNVSDFSNVAGDAVIDTIISGTSVSEQVRFLQGRMGQRTIFQRRISRSGALPPTVAPEVLLQLAPR